MEFVQYLWFHFARHVVDILIVAYIFYWLMLLVKGTRAVQIILGILTLIVFSFLAQEVLYLNTLSWLFEKFWLATMVILAVVFQPEIRSALAKLGSHRWGRMLLPSELSSINEIVEAVREFAQKHIGALIVLERETGLRNYIETGTLLNAQVTRELVLAIFNPGSPLHDGAAIIEDTHFIAAGCVLPLSHEPQVTKILGTRHRAALGLSEISDAIVLVVSEETGRISIARSGRLETGVDIEDLRHRLLTLYRESAERGFIRRTRSHEAKGKHEELEK